MSRPSKPFGRENVQPRVYTKASVQYDREERRRLDELERQYMRIQKEYMYEDRE